MEPTYTTIHRGFIQLHPYQGAYWSKKMTPRSDALQQRGFRVKQSIYQACSPDIGPIEPVCIMKCQIQTWRCQTISPLMWYIEQESVSQFSVLEAPKYRMCSY